MPLLVPAILKESLANLVRKALPLEGKKAVGQRKAANVPQPTGAIAPMQD
jgi:hypothetical protein